MKQHTVYVRLERDINVIYKHTCRRDTGHLVDWSEVVGLSENGKKQGL